MFEREAKLYLYMMGMCRRLASDIEPALLDHQPAPGIKAPLWVLGHLAICTDYAARMLKLDLACPADWHANFGPKTSAVVPASVRPTKERLLAAMETGHERVTAAVAIASAEDLARPHGVELLKDTPLETRADVLAHLMTTHEAFHLGQLSTWRRQMGFAPLF